MDPAWFPAPGTTAGDVHLIFDLRSMPVWIEPRLTAKVSYAEIAAGRRRAPMWRRLVRR
jgi:hypothetical protein